ncbi:hypothetical protein CC79DRAFT_464614 [Sarocladium strictum]
MVAGCSMCGVSFADVTEQRQHVKSEWHVYRLRCRVAGSGEDISAPLTLEHRESHAAAADATNGGDKAPHHNIVEEDGDSSDEGENEDFESDEDDEDDEAPEFDSGQCLFCNDMLDTLETNLEHMRRSHSFRVPYESHLNVDLETFIWFLHMVVHAYHECLSCGTRRGSAEGAKQHMVAKGHCQVDVAGEIADFYNEDRPQSRGQGDGLQIDGSSLRLSSGKVAGSRLQSSSPRTASPGGSRSHLSKNRQARNAMLEAAQEQASHSADAQDSSPSSSKALQKQAARADAMTKALSQLSASDQMTLAHLSSSEQRALLTTRKKQLSKAQSEERKARARVERLGNRTLMKHFKPDTPGRSNG